MARSDYLRARPSGLEERQGNDPAGRFPAPDLEGQRGARGRELGGNVREGDPLAERRGKAAARRLGHRFPVGTDRRPVARDRSGLGDLDPDEPALRAFGPFLRKDRTSDEGVVEIDEPLLAGFERGVVAVELLAREEVSLLEAEGVAAAETARNDAGREQPLGESVRLARRDKHLVAELSRVAGPAHEEPLRKGVRHLETDATRARTCALLLREEPYVVERETG